MIALLLHDSFLLFPTTILSHLRHYVHDTTRTLGIVPKGLPTDFCAAFSAGFFMACTVAPFDMVRTRLMNQPPDAKIYSGFFDCLFKIIKANGPFGLYAGFIPIWARFAPTTTLQLVIFEQVKPIFGVEGSGE
jgi:hypothetical protein